MDNPMCDKCGCEMCATDVYVNEDGGYEAEFDCCMCSLTQQDHNITSLDDLPF